MADMKAVSDLLSGLTPEASAQVATPDVQQILSETSSAVVSKPNVTIGDFSSTVDKEAIPDAIETQGLGSFNDQLQTQLRTGLSTQGSPVLTPQVASQIPGLSTLAGLESSLASLAPVTPQRIVGTEGNDLLAGGNGPDVILALGGDDVVIALNGNDLVRAGAGDDIAVGGGGRDFLFGEDGNDLIYGDSSDGLTFGLAGNDNIDGGNGDDTIFAGGNNDFVLGGSGSDFIDGEAGDDRLNGGIGDDYMSGGADNDSLFGGEGTDFLFGGTGNDTFNGDAGDDIAAGEEGDDVVFGGAGNDQLSGDLGNDQVIGGVGNDTVSGDDGDDTLIGVDSAVAAFGFGRGEIDRMTGGSGSDRFLLGQQGQKFYDDGISSGDGRGDYGVIEDFAADGTDKIQLSGNASNYVLREIGGDVPQGVGIFARTRFDFPIDPIDPRPPFSPEQSSMLLGSGEAIAAGDESLKILPSTSELIGIVANASTSQLSLSNSAQFTFV
jgi:Ca2+-binding RTX toxin-like protein